MYTRLCIDVEKDVICVFSTCRSSEFSEAADRRREIPKQLDAFGVRVFNQFILITCIVT